MSLGAYAVLGYVADRAVGDDGGSRLRRWPTGWARGDDARAAHPRARVRRVCGHGGGGPGPAACELVALLGAVRPELPLDLVAGCTSSGSTRIATARRDARRDRRGRRRHRQPLAVVRVARAVRALDRIELAWLVAPRGLDAASFDVRTIAPLVADLLLFVAKRGIVTMLAIGALVVAFADPDDAGRRSTRAAGRTAARGWRLRSRAA